MANLKVPYATPEYPGQTLELEVPDEQMMFQCLPMEPDPVPDVEQTIWEAVESPYLGPKFSDPHQGREAADYNYREPVPGRAGQGYPADSHKKGPGGRLRYLHCHRQRQGGLA